MTNRERQNKEILPPNTEVRVYSEIDRLRKLGLWGEPGVEAVLGQLLPSDISLFFKRYNVRQARQEFQGMSGLIEQRGVEIVRIKDAFVDYVKGLNRQESKIPTDLGKLSGLLKQKGYAFYDRHGEGNLNVLGLVDGILEEDAETYGERGAILLNYYLSLAGQLPLSNVVYAQDQSNALGESIVMSRMKWPIRRPEVSIYKRALEQLGYSGKMSEVSQGTTEGGDGILFDDILYVGVGVRTDREAVAELYRKSYESLAKNGIRVVAVVDEELVRSNPEHPGVEMEAMHLDTFWTPIDEHTVVTCMEEVEKRRVEVLVENDGEIEFVDAGPFEDFMAMRGYRIIDVTKEEQLNYATNLLNLGDGSMIVPLSDNWKVDEELEKMGYHVIPAEIKELVGGYGAVHCMSLPLVRENDLSR